MTRRARELTAYLLGDGAPSAATRRWLTTPEGSRALAAERRILRALDAWGRATARPAATTDGPTVHYGRLDTPVGPVLAAIGERGLLGLSFDRSEARFVADLARRHRADVVRDDGRCARLRRELASYFRGARSHFDLPVDLRGLSPFHRRVLAAARRIPPGRVVSYGDLARRIGRPRACRAVGQALGRNPVPIVIPCHRIVGGGGRLGGYVGGTRIKQKLLALEGAALARTGT
jgi:methylated-DNA-[protein]-cysteine S-methyltransferase